MPARVRAVAFICEQSSAVNHDVSPHFYSVKYKNWSGKWTYISMLNPHAFYFYIQPVVYTDTPVTLCNRCNSAEFDKFLEDRAKAADHSSRGSNKTPPSTPRPPSQTTQQQDRTHDQLFSLWANKCGWMWRPTYCTHTASLWNTPTMSDIHIHNTELLCNQSIP